MTEIENALINAARSALLLDVVRPNVAYVPKGAHARAYFLYAEPDNRAFGEVFVLRGIFQLTLCHPLGEGAAATNIAIKTLRATFPRGKSFDVAGLKVRIEKTPATGPSMPGTYFETPVRIAFFTDVMT